jgi:hypothetical protein
VHKPLYEVIEHIIELSIPLWNQTLAPLASKSSRAQRIEYSSCEYDPDPESWADEEKPPQLPNETEEDYYERMDQWASDTRRVVRPEPGRFVLAEWEEREYDGMQVDLKGEFEERGLQIIVKLANIHLTPEKADYAGGTWHVEGQLVRVSSFIWGAR